MTSAFVCLKMCDILDVNNSFAVSFDLNCMFTFVKRTQNLCNLLRSFLFQIWLTTCTKKTEISEISEYERC